MSSSNIEKIKILGQQISSKEERDRMLKKECVSCLEKIYNMLCKSKVDKIAIKNEVVHLMSKLDYKENSNKCQSKTLGTSIHD
jgi:hypothetical protein